MAKEFTNNTNTPKTATAFAREVRISPRKTRLVVDLIRGRSVAEAVTTLQSLNKGAAKPVLKVLLSAVANAEHNYQLNKDALVITKITVDEGPALQRWRPRARGSAFPILRPSSHITVSLVESKKPQKKSSKFNFPVILKRERKVKGDEHNHKHEHSEELETAEATDLKDSKPVRTKKESKEGKSKSAGGIRKIFNRRGGEK